MAARIRWYFWAQLKYWISKHRFCCCSCKSFRELSQLLARQLVNIYLCRQTSWREIELAKRRSINRWYEDFSWNIWFDEASPERKCFTIEYWWDEGSSWSKRFQEFLRNNDERIQFSPCSLFGHLSSHFLYEWDFSIDYQMLHCTKLSIRFTNCRLQHWCRFPRLPIYSQIKRRQSEGADFAYRRNRSHYRN